MTNQDPQHARRRRNRVTLPAWAGYVIMGLFVLGVVALGYLTFTGVKDFVIGLPGEPGDIPLFNGGTGGSASNPGATATAGGDGGAGFSKIFVMRI